MSDFLLSPWEFDESASEPATQTTIEWENKKKRTLLLKQREEFVYFRASGFRGVGVFDASLLPQGLAEIENQRDELQAIIASARYGRFFCLAKRHGSYIVTSPLHLFPNGQIILKGTWGRGKAKIRFELPETFPPSPMQWTRKEMLSVLKRKNIRRNLREARRRIEMAHTSSAAGLPLRWISGSEQELRNLIEWAVLAFGCPDWGDEVVTASYISATPSTSAAIEPFCYRAPQHYHSRHFRRLFNLFLQHNQSIGVTPGSVFRSRCFSDQLEFSAPTQHERLEVLLNLRDWLRDKVPESDIDAWLTPPPT